MSNSTHVIQLPCLTHVRDSLLSQHCFTDSHCNASQLLCRSLVELQSSHRCCWHRPLPPVASCLLHNSAVLMWTQLHAACGSPASPSSTTPSLGAAKWLTRYMGLILHQQKQKQKQKHMYKPLPCHTVDSEDTRSSPSQLDSCC